MPGPIVHTNAMEQCSKLLQEVGIYVGSGNYVDNMRADLDLDSHGYSFESNSGTIIEKIVNFTNTLKDLYNSDYSKFEYTCRLICHLCTDSFSIGQISSDLWGSKDDKIDAASEFVIDKKRYDVFRNDYNYSISLSSDHLSSMRIVYEQYKSKAKKWNFLISKDLASMVRGEVKFGAEFAFSWINLGLK